MSRERHSESHTDGSPISPVLDLAYLGTGSFQHVFTLADRSNEDWVYKVPAAFGYIVPYTPPRSLLTPHNPYEHVLKLALIRLPDAICRRVANGVARHRRARPLGDIWTPLAWLQRLCEGGQTLGRQVVAAYARPKRRQKFEDMLGILQDLVKRGLDDILLPFRVIKSGQAVLRVNAEALPYQGPILIQRKAVCLFESNNSFSSFDWHEVVVSVHRLWRVGVGLSDVFKPWAVLDGHARVFDTSGLTKDLGKLLRHLTEEHLDRREHIALREWAQVSADGSASKYCRFIRANLTRETLRDLWRRDLNPGSAGTIAGETGTGAKT